jgi:hypothetical protein
LNIENGPAVGQQGSELPSLDPPNFFVIGTDGKHGYLGGLAQFGKIVGVAIEQNPPDSAADGGASRLRQGRTHRLNDDGRGPVSGEGGLNNLQDLLALFDGIVVGMEDFQINSKTPGRGLRRDRLLNLIVVIVVGEGNYES